MLCREGSFYVTLIENKTMASWLDTRGGRLSIGQLGMQNMWIAHYVNGYNNFNNAAAWQYTSVSHKIGGNLDESIDYTGASHKK